MTTSSVTGRDQNQVARNATGRTQTADLYVLENAPNGIDWQRLTTATDIDTAETAARAAALAQSVRITINGVEYQRYCRPVLG